VILALGALIVAYLAVALVFFLLQRAIIYPAPQPVRTPSFSGSRLIDQKVAGTRVAALYVPAPDAAPVIVHFHGNAEQLADLETLALIFARQGLGFFAVEYPGYGLLSDEKVSEQAIYTTCAAALEVLERDLGVPPARIVLEGQSLGSGPATEMARRGHGVRLVLISPYTSIPAVGARAYPFLPVRWLARDHFDNLGKARSIGMPVLVLHGSADMVIPYELSKELAAAFPKAELVTFPGAGHDFLYGHPSPLAHVIPFVRAVSASQP
jgi:uncharacterized protein